jgi:single-strand DNA-binding protein
LLSWVLSKPAASSALKSSLATTDVFKDDKGQSHSHTEWHSIVFWHNLFDLAEKYIRKGGEL